MGHEDKVKQSSIECFICIGRGHISSQCPSKKSMVLKHGEYESLSYFPPPLLIDLLLVIMTVVMMTLLLGNSDEISCYVVPIEATHILLGRPWQFDRRVIHVCHSNKYAFECKGHLITLHPLSPKEVSRDQHIMKKKRESEKSHHVFVNPFSGKDSGSKTSSKGHRKDHIHEHS